MKLFKKLWSYMSFFKLAHFMHSCFWSVNFFSQSADVGNGREVGAESLVL